VVIGSRGSSGTRQKKSKQRIAIPHEKSKKAYNGREKDAAIYTRKACLQCLEKEMQF
jgi:hypothetical protein